MRRLGKIILRLLQFGAALAAIWFGGLSWFALNLPAIGPAAAQAPRTDGAVVLTGGTGRIERGLALLQAQRVQRLLVSGANPQTRAREIAAATHAPLSLFECCVDIDYVAGDTIGNASEAQNWARAHKFKSLTLVTSRLHMQRSLLEAHTQMPDIQLQADAVADAPTPTEIRREYHKYLFRLVVLRILNPLRDQS